MSEKTVIKIDRNTWQTEIIYTSCDGKKCAAGSMIEQICGQETLQTLDCRHGIPRYICEQLHQHPAFRELTLAEFDLFMRQVMEENDDIFCMEDLPDLIEALNKCLQKHGAVHSITIPLEFQLV